MFENSELGAETQEFSAKRVISPDTRDRLFSFAWTFETSPPGAVFNFLSDKMEVLAGDVSRDRFWAARKTAPRPPDYIWRRPLTYAGDAVIYDAGQMSPGHLLPGCLAIYENLLRDAGYRVVDEASEPESLLEPEPDTLLSWPNGEGEPAPIISEPQSQQDGEQTAAENGDEREIRQEPGSQHAPGPGESPACIAALRLASQRFAVFPLRPKSKTPNTPHGFKDASHDLERIKAWWTKNPNANIGIATGVASNLIVVDVNGENGRTQLSGLEAEHGPLPGTAQVKTGKGIHYYFKRPASCGRIQCSAIGGLDVRGDGGYVAGPGSIHSSGVIYGDGLYIENIREGMLELPEWFSDWANSRSGGSKGKASVANGEAGPPISTKALGIDKPPPVETMRAMLLHLKAKGHFKRRKDTEHDEAGRYCVSWVKAGMALKPAYGDEIGFQLWSVTHEDGRAIKDAPGQWKSFASEGRPDDVTIGTIIEAAKASGFDYQRRDWSTPHIDEITADPEYKEDLIRLSSLPSHERSVEAKRLAKEHGTTAPEILKDVRKIKLASQAERLPEGVTLDDFLAYMREHKYIFIPTGDPWPAASVNAKIPPILVGGEPISASEWLDKFQSVEQQTWAIA